MLKNNTIYLGDCLEVMNQIDDKSIDMICVDPPYNMTKNHWDLLIPIDKLWQQYERVIKDNGAIIVFGQDKFTAKMMLSNTKIHRYNLIWDKVLTSGFLNANKMPLRSHEDIMVFYKKAPTYNPQKTKGKKNHSKGAVKKNQNNNYGDFEFVDNAEILGDLKHPKSIISFEKPHPSVSLHPTEKPVSLFEYLIKTFSNEGDIVLDSCGGVMTTAVACDNTSRNWICIEKEEKYCVVGKNRVNENREILGLEEVEII